MRLRSTEVLPAGSLPHTGAIRPCGHSALNSAAVFLTATRLAMLTAVHAACTCSPLAFEFTCLAERHFRARKAAGTLMLELAHRPRFHTATLRLLAA